MKPRVIQDVSRVLCILPCVAALACAETHGGRSFLANRSSIEVNEAPVCASAVVDNDDCRPGNFGGAPWEKRPSFPPFSISDNAVRSGPTYIVAEVRTHYLGSPYYAGDVHAHCKGGLDRTVIPEDNTSLQEYELATLIEDRAVKQVASHVRSALDTRDSLEASALTTRFAERLSDEVRERVKARLLWFVTRYPGGMPDIARNDRLRKCLQETRSNPDASLVTGVAGYVVLNNQIDTAIGSEAVVQRALDYALRGHDDVTFDPDFRESLGVEWEQAVAQVAQIRIPRNDVTAVAWPMWVQFE
jgi:hypothetical protein